jgi:outer membrane protein TolC
MEKLMQFTTRNLSIIGPVAAAIVFLQAGVMAAQGKDYQALSLEDCQAIAREQNPVLGATREKVQELVADYQAARSKFFPRLVLLSYYDRLPPNRFISGALTNQELFKREGFTGVTGKQIIFDGLKTYYTKLQSNDYL